MLGYLAAGLIIGPFGLAIFSHPQTILHVAEFGVVLFLAFTEIARLLPAAY